MTPALQVLRPVVFVSLLLACLTLPFARSADAADEEQRLDESQARLDAVRAELHGAHEQQARDLDALSDAEERLRTVLEAVDEAEQAVDRQQAAVDTARRALAALERRVEQQRGVVSGHATQLYKQSTGGVGGGPDLESVLSAATTEEALDRSAYVNAMSRSDRRALELVDASVRQAAAQRRRVETEQAALRRVVHKERTLLADAEQLREDRVLQLAASSARVLELQGGEDHTVTDRAQLATLAMGASRQRTSSAASRSGSAEIAAAAAGVPPLDADLRWTWPAAGEVTSGFGPRWGRLHAGLDIAAPTGTPIVAAKTGVVVFAGRQGGYGNLVLVDHGGGAVTAYAHQSRIVVTAGQLVRAGQRLGDVGSTGSSTGPHLHFEVRVHGEPRNPRSFL